MKLRALILLTLLALTLTVAPQPTSFAQKTEIPEYLRQGLYFFYNGTLESTNMTISDWKGNSGNPVAWSFIYNYTIYEFEPELGDMRYRLIRIIREGDMVVKEEYFSIMTNIYGSKTTGFCILPEYIFDNNTLRHMIESLAIGCGPLNYTYEILNYTTVFGTVRAYSFNITAIAQQRAGNEVWTYGSFGRLVIAENGLLLETTLRYVNTTTLVNTTCRDVGKFIEETGGLALKLAKTNYGAGGETATTSDSMVVPICIVACIIVIMVIIVLKRFKISRDIMRL